jgi:hypothetical protein
LAYETELKPFITNDIQEKHITLDTEIREKF